MMIGKFILLCAVVYCKAATIHKYMTDEEIASVFRVARHAIPDYEIRPVLHTLRKRAAHDDQVVKLAVFGKDVELNLSPTDGMLYGYDTPVITAVPDSSKPFGVRFEKVSNPFKGVGLAYQDTKTGSAVVLSQGLDDSVEMSGRILNEYNVEPVPSRLKKLLRRQRSVDESDDTFEETHHHIIYKQPNPTEKEMQGRIELVEREYTSDNNTSIRSKRAASDIVYPEVLVSMDHALYETQKKDMIKALRYLLAFWNCVDLRYRSLTAPKIQLNIAGFVIATEPGATPFIKDDGQGFVDVDPALEEMNTFFYPDGRIPARYDIAIAMTGLDLFAVDQATNKGDAAVAGYATLRGACNVDKRRKQTHAVGLVEDHGNYGGITAATHELGHLLGARHDGARNGNSCKDEGFLMGAVSDGGDNNYHWSLCSKKEIRDLTMGKEGECLYNVPEPGTPLPRVLPGKLFSLHDQCQKWYGAPAALDRAAESCETLWCQTSERRLQSKGRAIEGSYCGEKKHCIAGHCVTDDGSLSAVLATEPKQEVPPKVQPSPPKNIQRPPPKSITKPRPVVKNPPTVVENPPTIVENPPTVVENPPTVVVGNPNDIDLASMGIDTSGMPPQIVEQVINFFKSGKGGTLNLSWSQK